MAEVAGLILGGFPLIISALEHYREGFEPLQEWWKFETEFRKFIEELGVQQNRFDMNLEKLLEPFVTSGAQMNAFLNQHSPEAWQDPVLRRDIRKRLGPSYNWYIAICNKMNDILTSLKRQFGIKDGQVTYMDASKWNHELRRLRISFSKKKSKHVKSLAKYNDQLNQLLTSNDELGPSRQRLHRTPMITLVQSLQQHSQDLYSGLLSRWRCKCTAPHVTRLLLERHTEVIESAMTLHLLLEIAGGSKLVEVRMSDHSSKAASACPVTNSANVNLLQLRQQVHERGLKASTKSPQMSRSNTTVQGLHSLTTKANVFVKPPSRQLLQATSAQKSLSSSNLKKSARFAETAASITAELTSAPTVLTADEIKDICSEMSGWQSAAQCLGYIPAATNSRLLFYPNSKIKNFEKHYRTVTLEDLLPCHNQQSSTDQRMTRKQRFTLANVLAFTLLQLQPTPWLSSNWSKQDITFIIPSSSRFPELSHPYIGKTFPVISSISTASKDKCKQSLFRLGILLLELTFNERLETLPLRENYLGPQGVPNEYTDLCTAKAWHREVEGECGEGLSDVIRRCIDCSFSEKPDWGSEAFLQEYLKLVLQPLQELLRQWESVG